MPKIFWLSVSHVENSESFLLEFADFAKTMKTGSLSQIPQV